MIIFMAAAAAVMFLFAAVAAALMVAVIAAGLGRSQANRLLGLAALLFFVVPIVIFTPGTCFIIATAFVPLVAVGSALGVSLMIVAVAAA